MAYFAVLNRQDSTAKWASSSEKVCIDFVQRQIGLFLTLFFTVLNLRLHFVASRIHVSDDAFLGKIYLHSTVRQSERRPINSIMQNLNHSSIKEGKAAVLAAIELALLVDGITRYIE